jgi:hypothetical protein
VQRGVPVVVLDVRIAPGKEQLPTGLVVAVLAAQVEGGEASGVGSGQVGPRRRQQSDGSGVALPGGFVQGAVAVLKKKITSIQDFGNTIGTECAVLLLTIAS